MAIRTIEKLGERYPSFQADGFAAKFAFPFAQQVCSGVGYDIGGNRLPWTYVDANGQRAMLIDPLYSSEYDAYNLPDMRVDYIFSSHCLEHLPNWVEALDYWSTKLHRGGVLFLYLPHPSQIHWRPWHNRKHVHSLDPDIIKAYLIDNNWRNIFVSGCDLNNSFMVIAEKS